MTDPWPIARGDTGPPYRVRLADDAGPIPLADAQVQFRMRRPGGGTLIDRPATIPEGDEGWVEYQWQPGDTAVCGLYQAQLVVTRPSGDIRTYPVDNYLYIRVTESIPPAPTS